MFVVQLQLSLKPCCCSALQCTVACNVAHHVLQGAAVHTGACGMLPRKVPAIRSSLLQMVSAVKNIKLHRHIQVSVVSQLCRRAKWQTASQ
jgi:hypothetical protein